MAERMTDKQVLDELGSKSLLDRARQIFSSEAARIEQANAQAKPPSILQIRRMEFEAAKKIVRLVCNYD